VITEAIKFLMSESESDPSPMTLYLLDGICDGVHVLTQNNHNWVGCRLSVAVIISGRNGSHSLALAGMLGDVDVFCCDSLIHSKIWEVIGAVLGTVWDEEVAAFETTLIVF